MSQNVPLSIAEETESPPQKKHKIKEGDEKIGGNVTSIDDGMNVEDDDSCSEYDSEEDYCPNGTEKMDKALWEKYYRQVRESEGFDIEDFPGRCWIRLSSPCHTTWMILRMLTG
ncbi:uncharacterized protein LOC107822001 isoform X2 [Nicotiana tabacum]